MSISWSAQVTVAAAQAEAFERAFSGLASVVSLYEVTDGREWAVEGLFNTAPPEAELRARVALAASALNVRPPQLKIAKIPERDWLTENIASFPPIRAGRYYIHGDHIPPPYPPGAIRLKLNAATAFGSGEDASTQGCLLALDSLRKKGIAHRSMLDMGCGTGILAIAAAKTWHCPVLAVDIDPEAVRVARRNARINGKAAYVKAVVADGCGHRAVAARAPYQLITANILARPLMAMAASLSALLAPGGSLVLAGLLTRQEAMVLNAYRAQGLRLARRVRLKPWSTLVLRKRGRCYR